MDTTIEKIERLNLILLGSCGAVIGVFGWLHLPSFLLGGGVMQLNFWLLKRIVRALVVPAVVQQKKRTLRALFVFLGKILLSLLLLSGIFLRYPIHLWSFMAGVSLLLVTCMIVTLLGSPPGPQVEEPEI